MIILDKFKAHIVLYCKHHYEIPNGDKGFFEGLKMVWAIRCGYDYKFTSEDTMSYVANDMYEIIQTCLPDKISFLMNVLHREIGNQAFWKPKDMLPIEALIWEYRRVLCDLQVKEQDKVSKKWRTLVKLPKPQRQLFNRILRGNGKHNDYEKVKL